MSEARLKRKTRPSLAMLVLLLAAAPVCVRAQTPEVTADVTIARASVARARAQDSSEVVVWLVPLDGVPAPTKSGPPPQIIQRNKTFTPHLVVVQVGQTVQFPNQDPFFHNIFSMYNGKRFDLGLYEAGSTRSVRFDRPGVSYLFCNIHAEMSAVVVALDSPYFAVSNRAGHIAIPGVPDGRYELHVWYERSLPDTLTPLTRQVTISASTRSLGAIRVTENPNFTFTHKNKYGDDYVPPPSDTYQHP